MSPHQDIMQHYAAQSRAIVVFKNNKAMVWGSHDGMAVMAWARAWDTEADADKLRVSAENGGIFHVVAYTVNTGFVSYETEH